MMKRLATRARGGARALHEDESGAALVFAAITLFSLSLATMMVLQVGLVSTDRMATQSSADAAAYSGAQVQANCMNAIGQINDGMAYTHYALLRYVVDQIVYGTLESFARHKAWVQSNASDTLRQRPKGTISPGIPTEFGAGIENQDAPPWVMIGDDQEWTTRWNRITQYGNTAVTDGKQWLQSLEDAGHLIVRETPNLVREEAARVAFANGASHFAISSDLEKAFVASTGNGAGPEGFIDAVGEDTSSGGVAGQAVAAPLPFRYTQRKLVVDGNVAREFPSWFDADNGESIGIGYTQIRLCWNVNDWAHHQGMNDLHAPPFSRYMRGQPRGHWHAKHEHHYLDNSTQPPTPMQQDHGGLSGSGVNVTEMQQGGGHYMPYGDDDPSLHPKAATSGNDALLPLDPHHAVVRCPTCWHSRRNPAGNWTEFWKEQGDADAGRITMKLDFGSNLPTPILLDAQGDALRTSVTVATWRESWGIGDLLPKSRWGMIAVASAQIGLMDAQGRVTSLRSLENGRATYAGPGGQIVVPLERGDDDPRYVNLFYGLDVNDTTRAPGLRFGARLVPVGRDLTHHRTLSNPVDELLAPSSGGAGSSRWYTISGGTAGGAGGTLNPGQEPTAELTELRSWVTAPSLQAVREVFWH